MRKVTLCFLDDGNRLCLAMKKRGFGKGKWNGVGGKVHEGESIRSAVIRELKEEIKVDAEPEDLEEVGDIKFFFKENPDWNQHMHIFFISKWLGEPKETDEMAPQWYMKDKIPYETMWIDDQYWLPRVLGGKKIEGECYFIKDGTVVEKFDLREMPPKYPTDEALC